MSLPELPDNPIAATLIVLMIAIFGWGGWKGVIALRRDWGHRRRVEEVEVTELVRRAATKEVARVEERLATVERRLDEVLAELAAERCESARQRRRAEDAEARVQGLLQHLTAVESTIAHAVAPDDLALPTLAPWLRKPTT